MKRSTVLRLPGTRADLTTAHTTGTLPGPCEPGVPR
jgi:hypothetical protein